MSDCASLHPTYGLLNDYTSFIQVINDVDLTKEEVEMLTLDLADMLFMEKDVVIVESKVKNEATVSACYIMLTPVLEGTPIQENGEYVISPIGEASEYLFRRKKLTHDVVSKYWNTAKVTWLNLPQHGKFVDSNGNIAFEFRKQAYHYAPDVGYIGKDRIVAMVDLMGYKIKVIYYLHNLEPGYGDPTQYCPKEFFPRFRKTILTLQTGMNLPPCKPWHIRCRWDRRSPFH
jgi:hypothetical protein